MTDSDRIRNLLVPAMSAQHSPGRWFTECWFGWNAACRNEPRDPHQSADWLHGWDHFQRRAAITKASGVAS